MRIIYIHQHFRTPAMGGGTRSYEFAKRFVASGHSVEMIAAWPTEQSRPEQLTGMQLATPSMVDGIRVHWIRCPYRNRMGYGQRLLAFARFALRAALVAAPLEADIVFATSTPLTVAVPAIYISWRRRIPMIFEVRDLWPDAPIAVGALRSPLLIAAARCLERVAYRQASHIVALSPGIRDGVCRRGIPESKISIIPNASDLDTFSPAIDGREVRPRLGLVGKFVCVHLGAIGYVNGLDFVLDCARELISRGIGDVVFVLHGEGSERPRLEKRCRGEGLSNVIFSGPSSKSDAARVLAASDASLTLVRDLPALHACSPNKFFDTIAAGRPVLANVRGWLEQLVTEEQIGLFIRPNDTAHFADRVIWLRDHPELRAAFGRNARTLAENQFARDNLAHRIEQVFTEASHQSRRRPPGHRWKRMLDVLLAAWMIALLAPLMAPLYALVRWNLGRPVWFAQKRAGLNGKTFVLYKFKTMPEIYDASGALLPDAQRITRFGRWLRRSSLDELPQLWNVLKGEMSLVGPRPLLPEYLDRYSEFQKRRHEVLPGVTGWAQVNGRNELSWQEQFELDVWYVDHISLGLDVRVLWMTLGTLLARKGLEPQGSVTKAAFEGAPR